jgi:D-sedoheptulose 7-phosphate isomerase
MDYYTRYAEEIQALLGKLPLDIVARVSKELLRACEEGRFIFVMGNGGSAATASHFANDLGKGGMTGFPRRFKVLALTDNVPLMTAWANDTAYEHIFSEQLQNFVSNGDVVIGISGSGNSLNVLNGLRLAREKGAVTIGLTGLEGGKMKEVVDYCCKVPSTNMQHIEDIHMILAHMIYSHIRDEYMPNLGVLHAYKNNP